VDLKKNEQEKIKSILLGCEDVENDTWNPQEDFFEYSKKSDILVYAEKDGRIIGFGLISLLIINKYCVYTIDEVMILRKFQGKKVARALVLLALRWFLKKTSHDPNIKNLVTVSISSNPKVVNNYHKNLYVTKTFDNSFNPSEDLVKMHHSYLKKYGMHLLHEDYPFCVKNLFPGSHKFDSRDKKYQFHAGVKEKLPPGFNHTKRGDAFAFMVSGPKFLYRAISFLVELFVFGPRVWLNKKIGFFRKIKYPGKVTKMVCLINGRIIERRIGDRRLSERRKNAAGICGKKAMKPGNNHKWTERRMYDRRSQDRRLSGNELVIAAS
jgi:GNAT superfamily N-acetyltransferase